jgi:hypothetical protein
MGSSAPQAPQYQVPAGQPSFIPNNAGFSAGVNTAVPGNSAIYQLSGANSPDSVQGQTVQAQIAGYNMSDADYAARFPGFANTKTQYQDFSQNLMGTQTPASMAQGNALMNSSSQYLDPGAALAGQASTAGAQDMSLGQTLINGQQAMDPMVQQELMQSGLQGAASSLGGAAALGGTAGQAAVGRNLGVGAENWINQQRTMGEGLQTTGAGLDTSLANAASTLGNTGTGMMTAGQGIINSATGNANQTLAVGSSIFQPRTFGLAGSDASNIALSNVAGVNNMNQFDYQTKVAAAAENAQIGQANSGAQAQASAQNTQAAVGTGTAVASTAATVAAMTAMSCWIARVVMPLGPGWLQFRSWMLLRSPNWFSTLYFRHGKRVARFIKDKPVLKFLIRISMQFIIRLDERRSSHSST